MSHVHVLSEAERDDIPAFVRRGRDIGAPREVQVKPIAHTHELGWSCDPPNAEGWWYYRPKGSDAEGIPLRVFLSNGHFHVLHPEGKYSRLVQTLPYEWWGPLPYPA